MRYDDPDERRRQFETIAVPCMRALYNTALRLTADAHDAEDGVQETYLRAFRTFDNFTPGTNAKAWLFTILYSVVINRHRRARREEGPWPVEELEARYRLLVEPPEGDLAEVEPSSVPLSTEVEAALRAVPEVFRTAVILVDVQELSYEEAARTLGCPIGTVQSRLFRGRRLLFAALAEYARRAGFLRSVQP